MADRWEHRDDRYRDREHHDRGMLNRAGDEVRSWFGDDDAARRRRMDEMRDERRDRDWGDRAAHSADRAWDRTRDTVRDWTDRDRDGRRGLAEWTDNDRAWDRSRPSYRTGGWSGGSYARDRDDYYANRERSFGDTSRYAASDRYYTAPSTSSGDWNASYTPGSHRPSYAGLGPRGYQRTDDRIREDICERLTEDPRIDASDIEVHVKGGEVQLEGSVRTREEKHLTEDVVERCSGVHDVHNSLKVRPATEVLGTARSGAHPLGLADTPPPTSHH